MEEIRDEQDLQKRLEQISPDKRKRGQELIDSGRKIRAVGFWNGPNVSSNLLPNPSIFQDENWNSEEKQMAINYLLQGSIVVSYMGLSFCRFNCGEIGMGSSDLSDGTYCWPEGLVHYLEKHNVRLPDEFIKHIAKNIDQPKIPKHDDDMLLLWFLALDFSWWKAQAELKK